MKSISMTRAELSEILDNASSYKKKLLKMAKSGASRPCVSTMLGKALALFTVEDLKVYFIGETK